jgi:hypothetical protein
MGLLEQLGEIYWHAGFYHDFFKLAVLHSQGPTTYTNGQEQDPLVAFLHDHMPVKLPVLRGTEVYSQNAIRRRTPNRNDVEDSATKPTATRNLEDMTANFLSVTTTSHSAAHTGYLASTMQAPIPYELASDELELGGVAIPDTSSQLFEDWLDEYGYFHNIFPSA